MKNTANCPFQLANENRLERPSFIQLGFWTKKNWPENFNSDVFKVFKLFYVFFRNFLFGEKSVHCVGRSQALKNKYWNWRVMKFALFFKDFVDIGKMFITFIKWNLENIQILLKLQIHGKSSIRWFQCIFTRDDKKQFFHTWNIKFQFLVLPLADLQCSYSSRNWKPHKISTLWKF